VLRPNWIIVERSGKALPKAVQDAALLFEEQALKALSAHVVHPDMTREPAVRLLDAIEDPDSELESTFCGLLDKIGVDPPGDHDEGLYCTQGAPFGGEGLPRSDSLDHYYPVSVPKPDYAYGYNDSVFNVNQQVKAQSRLYEPYTSLYWPFLIIEANSQAMGKNCFKLRINAQLVVLSASMRSQHCWTERILHQTHPDDLSLELRLKWTHLNCAE
jgi:hypothetical protein